MKAPDTHTQFRTTDIDEICDWERAQGIESRRRQLSRGARSYEADFLEFQDLLVWRYRDPHRLLHEFALPKGTVEICFTLCPEEVAWRGSTLDGSLVAIHLGGESYDSLVPSGSLHFGIVMPESGETFHRLLDASRLRRGAVATVPRRSLELFFSDLDGLLPGLQSGTNAAALPLLLDRCHEIASLAFEQRSDVSSGPNMPLVYSAVDLIRDRLREPMTVANIAGELNVNRRTLERAFYRHFGATPYQFMIVERLHHARGLLREGNRSVLDCLHQSGFEDASRFSSMYSRQFGELPSETKRNSN